MLPLVGSRMMVSVPIRPAFSAASIIATPMRSLTLWAGLKNSSLATTLAPPSPGKRRRRTRGVFPMSCVTSSAIFMLVNPFSRPVGPVDIRWRNLMVQVRVISMWNDSCIVE